MLSSEELARYDRHITLPEVGMEGQERLRATSVLLIGAGGLGSAASMYLAAAGVGRIGIVDDDVVDLSNLQRQVVHSSAAIGELKSESAARRLRELNPLIKVEPITIRLDASNADAIVLPYDIVVDGSDSLETRYVVNDACARLGKPHLYGAVSQFEGQVSLFDARQGTGCYRCLFPQPPASGSIRSCAEAGVFGVLPGLIGMIQATEVLKRILQIGESLEGRLLLVDARSMRFRSIATRRNPECSTCNETSAILRPTETPQARETKMNETEISASELSESLKRGESYQLIDVREQQEWNLGRLDGASLIPLNTLPARVSELSPELPTVVYCRSGNRSGRAAAFLRQHGFARVLNLAGGVMAWQREVDPTFRY